MHSYSSHIPFHAFLFIYNHYSSFSYFNLHYTLFGSLLYFLLHCFPFFYLSFTLLLYYHHHNCAFCFLLHNFKSLLFPSFAIISFSHDYIYFTFQPLFPFIYRAFLHPPVRCFISALPLASAVPDPLLTLCIHAFLTLRHMMHFPHLFSAIHDNFPSTPLFRHKHPNTLPPFVPTLPFSCSSPRLLPFRPFSGVKISVWLQVPDWLVFSCGLN